MGNQVSSRKLSLVALLVVAYASVVVKAGVVMVDAGSSGSKLFSFDPDTQEKVLTNCDKEAVDAGKTLKGLSAFLYAGDSTCKLESKVAGNKKKQIADRPIDPPPVTAANYRDVLLKELKTMNQQPSNGNKIPMMATAGMRLLTKEENDQVWKDICGKSHEGLEFNTMDSGFCGTIPGTREAYFEWGAMVSNTKDPTFGAFTIGGASAQIAIPLFTDKAVAEFKKMKHEVRDQFKNCANVFLPKECKDKERKNCEPQKKLGWFNRKKTHNPDGSVKSVALGDCHRDFVNFKKRAQLEHIVDAASLGDIKGLGVISFLGLKGEGGSDYSGVAGGLNEIGHWADVNNCGANLWNNQTQPHNTELFKSCKKKLEVALKGDYLWAAVSKFFKASGVNAQSFSYNTPSAIPSMTGLKHNGAKPKTGHSLATAAEAHCSKALGDNEGNRGTYGHGDSGSCVKSLYTSMYITSFFDNSDVENKESTMFPTKQGGEVTYDWADGAKADLEGNAITRKQKATQLRGQGKEPKIAFVEVDTSIYQKPLRWHSNSYADRKSVV